MRTLIAENENVKFEYEDDIVIGTFKVDTLDLDTAQKAVEWRLKMTQDDSYLFLIDSRTVNKFTKGARDYLSSARASERVIAAAILPNSSMVATALVNFFLKVSKPPVPTKLFTMEENAIKWLKTYK